MAPFNKILVPVDFSKHSERATALALELARKFESSLTLLHTSVAIKTVRARVLAQGIAKVDALLVEGNPFAEIVRTAREKHFDLIVMGTHGRTGLEHALMGSVAEKVVRKAPCPVLSVRDPEHEFELP